MRFHDKKTPHNVTLYYVVCIVISYIPFAFIPIYILCSQTSWLDFVIVFICKLNHFLYSSSSFMSNGNELLGSKTGMSLFPFNHCCGFTAWYLGFQNRNVSISIQSLLWFHSMIFGVRKQECLHFHSITAVVSQYDIWGSKTGMSPFPSNHCCGFTVWYFGFQNRNVSISILSLLWFHSMIFLWHSKLLLALSYGFCIYTCC